MSVLLRCIQKIKKCLRKIFWFLKLENGEERDDEDVKTAEYCENDFAVSK